VSKILVGLALLAVSIYGGSRVYVGYQDGRIVRPFFGRVPQNYDRTRSPVSFWVATLASTAFLAFIAVMGLGLVLLGILQ